MNLSASYNETYSATTKPPRLEFYRSAPAMNSTAFDPGSNADALVLYQKVASRLSHPAETVPAAQVIDQLERND